MRGFFAIGILNGKTPENIGTLWRHANLYNAAFVFTVAKRYDRQSSDTLHTPLHVPLMHYADLKDLREHLPWGCPLIGIELGEKAKPLPVFNHPERACYLLGAEDHGLQERHLKECHSRVFVPCPTPRSMNVSSVGTLIMYDRYIKRITLETN